MGRGHGHERHTHDGVKLRMMRRQPTSCLEAVGSGDTAAAAVAAGGCEFGPAPAVVVVAAAMTEVIMLEGRQMGGEPRGPSVHDGGDATRNTAASVAWNALRICETALATWKLEDCYCYFLSSTGGQIAKSGIRPGRSPRASVAQHADSPMLPTTTSLNSRKPPSHLQFLWLLVNARRQ